jgi:hypothetical protein
VPEFIEVEDRGTAGTGSADGTDAQRRRKASLSCSAIFNERSGRRRYGLIRGSIAPSGPSSAIKFPFDAWSSWRLTRQTVGQNGIPAAMPAANPRSMSAAGS